MKSYLALSFTAFAASALASTDYPTITPTPDPSSSPSSSCTVTLCVDKINSCGQRYGGCFASCSGSPWPSFTDPGCPTSSSATPSLTTLTVPTSTSCTNFKCVDSVNSCGRTYGGCYSDCPGSTTPIFTDPGCPTTTSPPTSSCTTTLCVDKINSCGQLYGGCFPACSGFTTPSFTDPGCPTTTSFSSSTSTYTPSSTSCPFICRDYFDDCGNTYGPGCYTACPGAPIPTFTTPYCDASATPTAYS